MLETDVLVVGGGHAGLCAAITAAGAGVRVLIIDAAPHHMRGGNTRHTRNLRAMHDAPTGVLTGTYGEDEYLDDLLRVTKDKTDPDLARMVIRQSSDMCAWLEARGVVFQPALGGTLSLERTNAFFLGGGRALLNALYHTAEKLGVDTLYDAEVVGVTLEDSHFRAVTIKTPDGEKSIQAKALVVSSGGFQANKEWMAEAWGQAADNFIVRGTPYNKGGLLRLLIDAGAEQVADANQCHAVAIDARAPEYDGGIVTRLDSVPFGIVVNKNAARFHDEGEDFWPKRYAIWGRLVADQPGQTAYCLVDSKSIELFMPSVFPPISATSIEGLAEKLSLDPSALCQTVDTFNAAVQDGSFDHTVMDDCVTRGLEIEKTHWARRLDTPPYYAWPLRPGITFTYLGLKVNEKAEVCMTSLLKGRSNIFAAGESMAGNVLGQGYLAGIGMTIGGVFGRLAGEGAARYVLD